MLVYSITIERTVSDIDVVLLVILFASSIRRVPDGTEVRPLSEETLNE